MACRTGLLSRRKVLLRICYGITCLSLLGFFYHTRPTELITVSSPISIHRLLESKVATQTGAEKHRVLTSTSSSLDESAAIASKQDASVNPIQELDETLITNNSSTQSGENDRNRDDGKYNLMMPNETSYNGPAMKDPHEVSSSTFNPPVNVKTTTLSICSPITKIVYIKTHKTASTTTESIFQRFGYRRSLLFALPKQSHTFYKFTPFSHNSVAPLPAGLATSYYDMLVNHAIYNRPELDKVVPAATYVTILRDPVAQLESAFGYFEMAYYMGLSKQQNPFEIFINNPMYYYTTKVYESKLYSRNGQLFDLGFDPELANDTNAILTKIATVDEEFDLVMIADYFDESLILLKKLLCWSFDDILYVKTGVRSKSHRYNITEDMTSKIRQWNAGDVLLYNHFNETFWRKVREYGPNFENDLEEFKRLEIEVFNKCISTEKLDTESDRREAKYMLYSNQSYCQDLVRNDIDYTSLLRTKQTAITEV